MRLFELESFEFYYRIECNSMLFKFSISAAPNVTNLCQLSSPVVLYFSCNLHPECSGFAVKNGTVEPRGKVSVNNAVTVSCVKPKRYFLFGEKEVTCQSTGRWSEKPTCKKCGKVVIFILL